jgi:hypothetical protein
MPAKKRRKGRKEPNTEGRSHPLLRSPSKWDKWFFNYHDLAGKAKKRKIGRVEDELTTFLRTPEEFRYSCEETIKRHCKGVSVKNIEDGFGLAGTRVAAWIDDRKSPDLKGSGAARPRKDWLTATGLLRYLKQPVSRPIKYKTGITHLLTSSSVTIMGMSQTRSGVFCERSSASKFTCTTLISCSYVENLTPDFILALAITASGSQTPILRDAMDKHYI